MEDLMLIFIQAGVGYLNDWDLSTASKDGKKSL
jgi:hypothetical protein